MTTPAPTPDDVLAKVDTLGPPGTPVTTPEVAEGFDCTKRTIYNRLDSLAEDGVLQTKKVGANSRVWWRPARTQSRPVENATPDAGAVSNGAGVSTIHADGEMAERIRNFGWAETSLGPMAEWPPELRIAVDIMLGAEEAIGIYWGDDHVLLYNDPAREQIGKKYPDALGRPARDVFSEAWETLGPIHEQVMAGNGSVRVEEEYLPLERDGEVEDIWWDSSFTPIPTGDGVGGVFNISFDVTDRVLTQQDLRETNERLEVALSAAGMGTWKWDLDERTVRGDEQMLSLFDLPPADGPIPVERYFEKMSPEGVTQCETVMESTFEPGEEAHDEIRLDHVDDPPRWVAWRGRVRTDDPSVLRGISYDVTERKQAELKRERATEALQERESKYHSLFEEMDEGFALCELVRDADGRVRDIRYDELNDAFEELTGVSRADAEGRLASEVFPGQADSFFETYERVAETGEPERVENYVPANDRWYEVRLFPREGDTVAVLYDDITERKEDELHREERYRTLFESINEGFCIVEVLFDEEGTQEDYRFLATNPAFEGITGLTDVDGELRRDLEAGYDPRFFNLYGEVARTGESQRFEASGQPLIDGWYDVSAFPYGEPNGNKVALLIDDITERKEAEQELERQAELDAFRVKLTDAIRPLKSPVDIQREAARILGEHLGVERANYGEVLEDENANIVHIDYYRGDISSVAGRHRLDDFGSYVREGFQAGDTIVVDDFSTIEELNDDERAQYDEVEISAWVGVPLVKDDRLQAFFVVNESEPREWTDAEVAMVEETAERTWAAVEQARAQRELTTELEAMRRLHELSTRSTPVQRGDGLYDEILDTAVDLVDADFGSLQRFDDDANELELLSHHGFTPEAADLRARLDVESPNSHSRALQTGERVVISDIETCEWIADSEDLQTFRQTGIRAVQTTPLVSRSGEIFGTISTHWADTHDPSERDLHLLDILARQVADVLQQRSAYEALQESEERYRTLFESIDEGFCIVEVLFDDDEPIDYRFLETNPAFEGKTGLTDAEGKRMRDLEPDHEEYWFETYGRIAQTGEAERFQNEAKHLGDRWYDVYGFRIGDPEERKVAILFGDVTEQKRTQRSLERLTVASRELIDAETETIHDRVAELTVDVLDVEYAALWRYDSTTGTIQEHERHTNPEIDPSGVRLPEGVADRVWETFISDEVHIDNELSVPETDEATSPLCSWALVPLGRHGVICIGSTQTDVLDEQMVDLMHTVAATIETAWDHAEGEQQLADQNEELQHLDRLNTLIRKIDQALVQAETVDAIDETVCERLADSALFEFAWVGEYDADDDAVVPRGCAGVDGSYLDDLTAAGDESVTGENLFETAIQTGELQVVADIATDARASPWREPSLERGARSCVAVPLVFDESVYGVLAVYGGTPHQDECDTDVLAELGETIAHAINAIETRETLRTDSVVELTLRTTDANTPLCRLGRQLACRIEFEGFVPGQGSDATIFFTVVGVSVDEFVTASEQMFTFTDLTCLVDDGTGSLFRARMTNQTLASLVVKQNAAVRSLTIDGGTATLVADVFRTDDVSRLLDRIQESVPDLRLLSRTTRTQSLETQYTFSRAFEERVTSRQQEVLHTAYRSGFFQSPRALTGTELASSLDISPATLTHHLREAERKLCELVFDPA